MWASDSAPYTVQFCIPHEHTLLSLSPQSFRKYINNDRELKNFACISVSQIPRICFLIFFHSLYCRHVSSRKSPGGKHVTITVRETKTERLTPVNQNYHTGPLGNQDIERQIIQTQQNSSTLAPRASSATKELDDLMASLSDFKVRFNHSNSHTHTHTQS